MVILSQNDMFDIKVSSLLADYDRDTITNLYQPIIGYTALAVYFTFWSESENQKIVSLSSHEEILLRMKISTGEFIEARKQLEAVGLVKTKLEKANNISIYHYVLYAPKTPSKFFNDALLYGLLIQNLGESLANKIKRVYETNVKQSEGEDISATFNDVFHPDFNDAAFIKAAMGDENTLGRKKSKIDTEFSYERFFEVLKEISQISEKGLTKKELKEIERLSTLYGVSVELAAEKVANTYDPSKEKGNRVDFKQFNEDLKNEVNYGVRTHASRKTKKNTTVGEDGLAAKIKYFEIANPKDVLTALQNGTKPARADLNIIYSLAEDYKLNNAVINVIIDFVLQMNNNVLSKYSVEKIASSISREGIETAIDAMEYLNTSYAGANRKAEKSEKKYTKNSKKEIIEEQKEQESDNLSDEEIDALLDYFKGE
ncbi:MAG: DnaD domain protein [Bacilli bacterium]|nr:DnaD domain protein [Bacilli bacterium]